MEAARSSGAIALINDIIEKGVKSRASDIHLEPQDGQLKVRYRVDGMLHDSISIHRSQQAAAISRVKVMVDMDIAEHRLPQDGRTHLKVDGKDIDLRVSTIPTVHGEKVVMRILDRSTALFKLEQLGLSEKELYTYKSILSKPAGIILATGPTGSGKTTTLYASLSQINSHQINIVTIEDPVEYQLPGINQIPINNKTGLNFAKGLRHILRQDPDVIMVGEIRDVETARIAIQASLTGHLVFSTNDACSAVARLIDMEIEPYLIAASLSGILAQRLIRTVCPNCSQNYEPGEREAELINFKGTLKRARGCKACSFTGYHGRTGVYEILPVTQEIRELIGKKAPTHILRQKAESEGMRTLLNSGVEKIIQEKTTIEEVMRVLCLSS
jgi:type II secretory ATPase GspE/PulE/Tfp pilus assembly ATPase PilB-like protein